MQALRNWVKQTRMKETLSSNHLPEAEILCYVNDIPKHDLARQYGEGKRPCERTGTM